MNQGNRGPANYLRSSSLVKTYHMNEEIDPQTNKPRKERAEYDPNITEEISITLTYEKAQDLINRIVAATQDQSGTGGVRISMYCRRSQNQQTGEVFDGMGILIYAQKPPQNGFQQGGRFQGQGRGNFQGGGRRSYPPRQAQGGGQPQYQARVGRISHPNPNLQTMPRQAMRPQPQSPVTQGTQQSGPTVASEHVQTQTHVSHAGGAGPNVQNDAYPSDGYDPSNVPF